jgi:hypothetical protein
MVTLELSRGTEWYLSRLPSTGSTVMAAEIDSLQ